MNGTKTGNSIGEKIFSNRIEYYINDKYVSTNVTDTFEYLLYYINYKLLIEEVYDWLVDFLNDDYCNAIIVEKFKDDKINIILKT